MRHKDSDETPKKSLWKWLRGKYGQRRNTVLLQRPFPEFGGEKEPLSQSIHLQYHSLTPQIILHNFEVDIKT